MEAPTGPQKRRNRCCRTGVLASRLTLDDLAQWFHLPTREACARLGISISVLKRLCRQRGIARWPYRAVAAAAASAAARKQEGQAPPSTSVPSQPPTPPTEPIPTHACGQQPSWLPGDSRHSVHSSAPCSPQRAQPAARDALCGCHPGQLLAGQDLSAPVAGAAVGAGWAQEQRFEQAAEAGQGRGPSLHLRGASAFQPWGTKPPPPPPQQQQRRQQQQQRQQLDPLGASYSSGGGSSSSSSGGASPASSPRWREADHVVPSAAPTPAPAAGADAPQAALLTQVLRLAAALAGGLRGSCARGGSLDPAAAALLALLQGPSHHPSPSTGAGDTLAPAPRASQVSWGKAEWSEGFCGMASAQRTQRQMERPPRCASWPAAIAGADPPALGPLQLASLAKQGVAILQRAKHPLAAQLSSVLAELAGLALQGPEGAPLEAPPRQQRHWERPAADGLGEEMLEHLAVRFLQKLAARQGLRLPL